MRKAEEKMISWVNRYMVHIAIFFVVFSALWMRLAGRNYVGIDYHFSLYDIAGNCNSFLFRSFMDFVMSRWTDYAINLLKILAYIGDFGVALLTCILLREKMRALNELQVFFAITACLLSPVTLLYSVSGMKIDSVCMCILLLGYLLCQKGWILPALPVMSLAAFLYPPYWPIVIIFAFYELTREKKKSSLGSKTVGSLILLLCLLIFSVFLENQSMDAGYYWGKIFVINPETAAGYTDIVSWSFGMFRIYGYFLAMLSLLLSFRRKKLRIPALVIQLLVLMIVGWYQTGHFAV